MVKGKNDEPTCEIDFNTAGKIVKKKKKSRNTTSNKEDKDLNLVPSNIDPSVLVHVPKDHRVNVDGVLDEEQLSNLEIWAENAVDLVPHAEVSTETVGATAAVAEGNQATNEVGTTHGGVTALPIPHVCVGTNMSMKNKGRDDAENNTMVECIAGDATGSAHKKPEGKPDEKQKGIVGVSLHQSSNQPAMAEKTNGRLNFAGLFKENRLQSNGIKLSLHEFTNDEVVLDENDVVPIIETWGFCLIGCFTGPFPGRPALDKIVANWGVKCRIFPYGKGWTVFRFVNEHDRLKVFNGGPYMAFGKTLMLKVIDDGVVLTDDLFTKVPTWVLLHEVPLSVWSESGLSKLSSKIGTPLYTDKITKERSRMNYARCLIEVDVGKHPILEYEVTLPGGTKYVQKVSYEHFPDFCCTCKKFGHNIFNCPKAVVTSAAAEPSARPTTNSSETQKANMPSLTKNTTKAALTNAPQLAKATANKEVTAHKEVTQEHNAPISMHNSFVSLNVTGETSNARKANTEVATVETKAIAEINNEETMVESAVIVVPDHAIAQVTNAEWSVANNRKKKHGGAAKPKRRGMASHSSVPQ